ncbi:helix-turn-helix domain-containing protein [Virgibacillus sp. W0430]|uniref:helix-turn-helix domain-containing protein n=1 Tax=Virgibacillus sp. W0430 TaxID=3391580 RepID=UPI003F47B814
MTSRRSNYDDKDKRNIISELILRRKELGLTQRGLAKRANLHQTAIARLEKEGAIPRLDTLEKVAEALELKLVLIEKDRK